MGFKMENAYGIGITNRYALFLDEDADPLDILKQSEADQKLAKAKKIEEATKPAPKSVKKEAVNNKNDNSDKENQRNNARFDGKRVLDARKAGDGPREERNNMRNQEGGRMEGGMGGGRGGKREYERKSGDGRTGVKAEDKRGGGGKGNWGTFEDDPKEGDETANNTSVEEAPVDGEAPAEDKEPVEEEMKTLTLDEWKAQQKKEAPKFNLRKAGEGSDIDPKWKKATSYKKVNEEQSEDEEEETVVYLQRANRQKKLGINFTFADQDSGRGGGRGRGGDRGGRGRGGNKQ